MARNQALAANMKRLRAGRSIGVLRAEMAAKGHKIGAGTLQRAINGEAGNRLESLEKIAEFFDTTVDQLLQFDGVDETYWPFSEELQQKVLRLSDEELLRAENILRGFVDLPKLSLSDFTNTRQLSTSQRGNVPYAGTPEDGAGVLDEAEVPASKLHERQRVQRPTHRKGGGGA